MKEKGFRKKSLFFIDISPFLCYTNPNPPALREI